MCIFLFICVYVASLFFHADKCRMSYCFHYPLFTNPYNFFFVRFYIPGKKWRINFFIQVFFPGVYCSYELLCVCVYFIFRLLFFPLNPIFFSRSCQFRVCYAMVKIFAIKNAIFSLFCHQFIWHGFLPLANACIWYNGYLIFRFETNIFVLVRCLARFWPVLREINWLVAVANYGLQSFSAPFFKKTEHKHFQSIYFPRLDTNIDLVHEFGTQTKKKQQQNRAHTK